MELGVATWDKSVWIKSKLGIGYSRSEKMANGGNDLTQVGSDLIQIVLRLNLSRLWIDGFFFLNQSVSGSDWSGQLHATWDNLIIDLN